MPVCVKKMHVLKWSGKCGWSHIVIWESKRDKDIENQDFKLTFNLFLKTFTIEFYTLI